jgi:hypothetical protein
MTVDDESGNGRNGEPSPVMIPAGIVSEWFFSAPYEAPMVRRGDPLGLRLAAARYADALAPGLSNRTLDARWLTISAWVLVLANDVWRRSGNSAPAGLSRRQTANLFGWIEPLELLWISRTLSLADAEGRQLPGQRAVRRWLEGGQRARRFGMSFAQYRRQRSIGIYGAYRVALRALPGMTIGGDGWRPDAVAELLARITQSALGAAAATPDLAHGNFDAESYWRREGWSKWSRSGRKEFLPESVRNPRPVTAEEISVLKPVLFSGNDPKGHARLRETVVDVMHASKARVHHGVCNDLEKKLSRATHGAVARLGTFAQLADTGLGVMNAIWACLRDVEWRQIPAVRPADLADDNDVRAALTELVVASKAWLLGKSAFRAEWVTANELAGLATSRARNFGKLVRGLVEYHEARGGGRRWFRLDEEGFVRPASSLRDQQGSPYRFRLFSLARLALQCRMIPRMPKALDFTDEEGEE